MTLVFSIHSIFIFIESENESKEEMKQDIKKEEEQENRVLDDNKNETQMKNDIKENEANGTILSTYPDTDTQTNPCPRNKSAPVLAQTNLHYVGK